MKKKHKLYAASDYFAFCCKFVIKDWFGFFFFLTFKIAGSVDINPFLSTSSSRSKWLLNLIRVRYDQIIASAAALLKTGAEHYQAAQEASE